MDPNSTPTDETHSLPKRTTPTWEMELLLSGATVFALFQVVQALQAGSAYMLTRLDGAWHLITMLLFTYGQGAVTMLLLSFSLHLLMRAYWVALVGMNSVFPGGLKIERTRAGPIGKAQLAKRWENIEASIERADNRATIIFALGVAITLVIAPVTIMVVVLFALAALLAWATGWTDELLTVYGILAALLYLPYFVVTTIDKRRGDRMMPHSRGYRWITATLNFYSRIGMGRDTFPLLTVFYNNIGERIGTAAVMIVMMLVLASSSVGLVLSMNELGIGSYGDFPSPARGLSNRADGRHYETHHDPARPPAVPYLPDMVVRGPYLRLVVPFVPVVHGHLLDACEAAKLPGDKIAEVLKRNEGLRACLAEGIAVKLDGQPVSLSPDWYSEPGRDLRGLVYMIPAQGLAAGRHELSVLFTPKEAPGEDKDPTQPYLIAFWR